MFTGWKYISARRRRLGKGGGSGNGPPLDGGSMQQPPAIRVSNRTHTQPITQPSCMSTNPCSSPLDSHYTPSQSQLQPLCTQGSSKGPPAAARPRLESTGVPPAGGGPGPQGVTRPDGGINEGLRRSRRRRKGRYHLLVGRGRFPALGEASGEGRAAARPAPAASDEGG